MMETMPHKTRLITLLLGVVACPTSASGQTLYRSVVNRDFWPDFQVWDPKLVHLPDYDDDGVGEILLGDPIYRRPQQIIPWGRVTLLDGRTAEVRHIYDSGPGPFNNGEGLGLSVADLGDVNGDGIGDYMAGCLDGGPARIWSGKDGSEIFRSKTFVEEVTALGDVNRDGIPDFGMRRSTPPWGSVDVHAGGTFEYLYTARPPFLVYLFGYAIVSLGDVDGDESPDFAVSAPDNAWNPFAKECHRGYVFVFSGTDGHLLYEIPAVNECNYFGYSLAALGDITGDEVGDLAIGAPEVGLFPSSGDGRVHFHDGRTGDAIGKAPVRPGRHFFYAKTLLSAGDCNGNGYPDVFVSNVRQHRTSSLLDKGEALLVDGGTFTYLYSIQPAPSTNEYISSRFAQAMTSLGDVNDDDFPDFLIGSTGLGTRIGRLDWFYGAPQGVRAIGEPCSSIPGITPRIGASGVPRIGREYEVHLSRVDPGQKAFLVVGFSARRGRALLLTGDGPGCEPLVTAGKLHFAVATRTAGKNAAATVRITIANDPDLAGQTLYAQWILVGGRGTALTRVLQITIQEPDGSRETD